ncbi:MAG: aspartyl protease family protein [Bacillota bacterium]
MNIQYKNGLVFTTIEITFRGSSKIIDNTVIDTGACETIISPDIVEDIGIFAELNDKVNSFYGVGGSLHNFFSKVVDEIKIGDKIIGSTKVDFGVIDPEGTINGLLGLDFLMEIGAVIDLKNLEIKIEK